MYVKTTKKLSKNGKTGDNYIFINILLISHKSKNNDALAIFIKYKHVSYRLDKFQKN